MSKPNWENRTLFHGDNLDFMLQMNSESVDLIATDPPFNKGKDFRTTPDSTKKGGSFHDRWEWDRDVHQEWVDQIKNDNPKLARAIETARFVHSDAMGAFTCYMAVRFMSMRRILKPKGIISIHCDHTASHYLKLILDSIFGKRNFINEVTWRRTNMPKTAKVRLPNNTDSLLIYSKASDGWYWCPQYHPMTPKEKAKYKTLCPRTGKLMKLTGLLAPANADRPNLRYKLMGVLRTWMWEKEKMMEEVKQGRVIQTNPGTLPQRVNYLKDAKGKMYDNNWIDITALRGQSKEHQNYPTQKPLALYERLIELTTKKTTGVVFDPFAGCATTCVAAERLGRQWIGIDIWDDVADIVRKRMEEEKIQILEEEIIFTKVKPERTDDGKTAEPYMRVRRPPPEEPPGPKLSRAEMKQKKIDEAGGNICDGCDREFPHHSYLELDHNTPRSSGGINHESNRILLCPPCNKRKSNLYTLKWLRKENHRIGWMANQEVGGKVVEVDNQLHNK